MDKNLYLSGCNNKLELNDINGVVTNYTEWGGVGGIHYSDILNIEHRLTNVE